MIHWIDTSSTIKYGTQPDETTVSDEENIDAVTDAAKGRSFANKYPLKDGNNANVADDANGATKPKQSVYAGKKEDDLWWKDIEPKLPNLVDKQTQTLPEMYHILVRNMGIFRWQNPQFVYLYIIYINHIQIVS